MKTEISERMRRADSDVVWARFWVGISFLWLFVVCLWAAVVIGH